MGLRQRKTDPEEDFDTVLKHHNQAQAKLAEEMVHLARNMKENAKAAGRIVREDNKVLVESAEGGIEVIYLVKMCHIQTHSKHAIRF